MRRPSPRLFPNTVTVRSAAWSNVRGVRKATHADTTHRASVQPSPPGRSSDHDRAAGSVAHVVLFAADPGVKADDLILWNGRTLVVEGPASDQAGRGATWLVACSEEV